MTTARHSSSSFLPLFQAEIYTAPLLLKMLTNNSPRDVDSVTDTGPIDWGAIDSDRSGEETKAVELGEVVEPLAQREP